MIIYYHCHHNKDCMKLNSYIGQLMVNGKNFHWIIIMLTWKRALPHWQELVCMIEFCTLHNISPALLASTVIWYIIMPTHDYYLQYKFGKKGHGTQKGEQSQPNIPHCQWPLKIERLPGGHNWSYGEYYHQVYGRNSNWYHPVGFQPLLGILRDKTLLLIILYKINY